jgi:hypothetical protein
MSVRSGQSVTVLFTTRGTSGGVNADSQPTSALYVNGTVNGAAVTVTNISTGLYKAAVTLPTLAVGDEVELIVAATVGGVSDTAVIWGDTKDVFAGAIPDAAANANGGLPILSNSGSTLGYTISTLTTYTGNTPQTGDAFGRLGVAGVGLTNLGDSRIAHLDADVSSRLASSSYVTPPSAATIGAQITSDHGAGNYVTPSDYQQRAVAVTLPSVPSDYATSANQITIINGVATVISMTGAAAGMTTLIRDLLQADQYIDTSTTPWDLVLIKMGTGNLNTGTVLLRQALKDTSGTNISGTAQIPGSAVT